MAGISTLFLILVLLGWLDSMGSGVDDAAFDIAACEHVRCAGLIVADHVGVDAHRFDVADGIERGFALGDGRTLGGEQYRIGREPAGGRDG